MERVKLYLEENNPQQVNIDNIIKEYSYDDYRSESGNFVGASAGAI